MVLGLGVKKAQAALAAVPLERFDDEHCVLPGQKVTAVKPDNRVAFSAASTRSSCPAVT